MVFPAAHTTTPASGDVNNGAAISTGVRFTVNASKTCDGIAFRVPGTNTGTYTGTLYETTSDDSPGGSGTGTVLSSGAVAAATVTAGTWAVIPLAVAQALTTGKVYTAAVHSSSGRIVSTSHGLDSAITGNGVTLLAPGTDPNPPGLGTMTNGVFTEGVAPAYPNTSFNNSDYFADVSLATGLSATLATATETDTGGTLGRAKARTLAVAGTTDTAQTITRAKRRTLAVAGDTATAGTLGRTKARTLGIAGDAATAGTLARIKARTLTVAGDTATAGTMGRVKARTLGIAGDASTAGTLTRVQVRILATATETDMARVLGKVRGLSVVGDTSTALTITHPGTVTGAPATQRATVVRAPQRASIVRGPQRASVVRDG